MSLKKSALHHIASLAVLQEFLMSAEIQHINMQLQANFSFSETFLKYLKFYFLSPRYILVDGRQCSLECARSGFEPPPLRNCPIFHITCLAVLQATNVLPQSSRRPVFFSGSMKSRSESRAGVSGSFLDITS